MVTKAQIMPNINDNNIINTIYYLYSMNMNGVLTVTDVLNTPYMYDPIVEYIVTCQAHPVLVKQANRMCGLFLLKYLV